MTRVDITGERNEDYLDKLLESAKTDPGLQQKPREGAEHTLRPLYQRVLPERITALDMWMDKITVAQMDGHIGVYRADTYNIQEACKNPEYADGLALNGLYLAAVLRDSTVQVCQTSNLKLIESASSDEEYYDVTWHQNCLIVGGECITAYRWPVFEYLDSLPLEQSCIELTSGHGRIIGSNEDLLRHFTIANDRLKQTNSNEFPHKVIPAGDLLVHLTDKKLEVCLHTRHGVQVLHSAPKPTGFITAASSGSHFALGIDYVLEVYRRS